MALWGATIIGAGPAGLATAAMLQRSGVKTLILERADKVADSWRRQYDRLTLHTIRSMSGLPGYPIPREYGRWVSRSCFIDYLEQYAQKLNVEPQLGVAVDSIIPSNSHWSLNTSDGVIETNNVVVATGANRVPFMPSWPGLDVFEGHVIHASQYRNALPYQGRDVLVVGSGNTAAEILTELAEAETGRLRIAVRTPPNIMKRQVAGVPAQVMGVAFHRLPPKAVDLMSSYFSRLTVGNLQSYGLAPPPRGMFERCLNENSIPIIDAGFVEKIKSGRIECLPAVERFTEKNVVLADGREISTDTVIAATGYRTGLEHLLRESGVTLVNGRPARSRRRGHSLPGLYFIGFTTEMAGVLRQIGKDAVTIARAIAV